MSDNCYSVIPAGQEIEGVSSDTPFNFPPGGAYLLFYFTEETFTKVLSALWNGAALTYPDQMYQVIWYFLQNVEAPMSLCEQIINCIQNDEDTREALINTLAQSPEFQEIVRENAGRATYPQIEALVVPSECDNSALAGRVIQLVDVLDTNNVDFLQIVEVGTNDEERVSLLLAAIPIVSESPVDEILTLFQGFLDDFTENYNAAITLAWKNEVSEELYCLARKSGDCSLSYEQVFQYFVERAGSDLTILSLVKNIIQFVINGDFSTDNLVASGMYAIQLAFIVAGQDFYGLNIPTIGAVVRDAPPSSAWEDWNECVDEPERIPVVNSVWDAGNYAGQITGPDENGLYTATSKPRSSGSAFYIMDIDKRDFILTDIEYSGPPECQVFVINANPFYIACTGTDAYGGQVCDEFCSTYPTPAPSTMKFKMIAPPP